MPLEPGTRLGRYEVIDSLGAGGMGEVYRALDTDLRREVALKVLPEAFSRDPQRIGRLRREARLLAQLNHPAIATLHGFEEADGLHFLIMEIVEGETLAERIGRRPLKWREAVAVFRQIAEALDRAHRKGIVHRDMKPANIHITKRGAVKVLDFGLAKLVAGSEGIDATTVSADPTRSGAIVGTVAYMSPEQARGQAVDRQADIWAFGCCLYEALAGRKAFEGSSAADVLSRVLESEPDWGCLPPGVPSHLVRLIQRALHKDPDDRLRDIGDARHRLVEEHDVAPPAAPLSRARSGRVAWLLAGLIGGLLGAWLLWGSRSDDASPQRVARMEIVPPPGPILQFRDRPIALSPDGRLLVFATFERLYIRRLDQLEATPIPETEGANSPFFSPDSRWIGFWQGGELKKLGVDGGAPISVAPAESPYGVSWAVGNRIFFGQGPLGIFEVSADGGHPQLVVPVDWDRGEIALQGPQLLPGGRLLFTVLPKGENWNGARVVVQDLDSAERTTLIEDATDGRYVASGHLVFAQGTTLAALPFDVETLRPEGAPVPVVAGVARSMLWEAGSSHSGFSDTGDLAYVTDRPLPAAIPVWVDRNGGEEALAAPPRGYQHLRLSPDESRVILDTIDTQDLWLYDLERETMSRVTTEQTHLHPVWHPDGRRVLFDSSHATGVYWKPADANRPADLLISDPPRLLTPVSVSPDGRYLAFERSEHHVTYDIAILDIETGASETFLDTEFQEMGPVFSPDGHWIAYVSNETGRNEVYVVPYPGPGPRVLVSTNGGVEPTWSRDGGELFYRQGAAMMGVSVRRGAEFSAGRARKLFEGSYRREPISAHPTYDVASDGRFLMLKGVAADREPTVIHVVLAWAEELAQLAPSRR